MANKYNWIIASESTSSLVPGNVYYVAESKWSSDKMQAEVFTSKVKAETFAKTLDRDCSVEKQ